MVNKKGLILTLMTVAVAGLCVKGYSLAPVVTDPGDLIVGDLESGAGINVFAFDDAFSLDQNVSDDTTADSGLQWSFSGTGKYLVNGVGPLNLGPENPVTPPVNKELRTNDADLGHPGQDAAAETVTVRNNDLSDITVGGGFGPYANPGTSGVLPLETQPITLYASDGLTYGLVTIVVYTANDTSDSISGGGMTPIFDFDYTNPAFRTGWFSEVIPSASAGTTGTGTGFCMWVPTANVATSMIRWTSPNNKLAANWGGPGYIDLIDDAVYRVKATMYTDQTANDSIPFWTFSYNNNFYAAGTGTLQSNIYGGDSYQLDVGGGASGIGRTQGRTTFTYWFMPNAALTQSWKGTLPGGNTFNAFAVVNNPAFEARNDINLSVRILDGNAAINANQDTGTICLKSLRADRIDYNKLTTSLLDQKDVTSADFGVLDGGGTTANGSLGGGTGIIDNPTKTCTFTLAPDAATDFNGARKRLTRYNPAAAPNIRLLNYPLANNWHNDELILLKTTIRSNFGGAAGTVEGTDPVNVIFIDWGVPTAEIGAFNFTQKGSAGNMKWAASPRLLATNGGVPQEYVSFFYTQNVTVVAPAASPNADRVRPFLEVVNTAPIGNATDGRNPFTVTSFATYKVDISGLP